MANTWNADLSDKPPQKRQHRQGQASMAASSASDAQAEPAGVDQGAELAGEGSLEPAKEPSALPSSPFPTPPRSDGSPLSSSRDEEAKIEDIGGQLPSPEQATENVPASIVAAQGVDAPQLPEDAQHGYSARVASMGAPHGAQSLRGPALQVSDGSANTSTQSKVTRRFQPYSTENSHAARQALRARGPVRGGFGQQAPRALITSAPPAVVTGQVAASGAGPSNAAPATPESVLRPSSPPRLGRPRGVKNGEGKKAREKREQAAQAAANPSSQPLDQQTPQKAQKKKNQRAQEKRKQSAQVPATNSSQSVHQQPQSSTQSTQRAVQSHAIQAQVQRQPSQPELQQVAQSSTISSTPPTFAWESSSYATGMPPTRVHHFQEFVQNEIVAIQTPPFGIGDSSRPNHYPDSTWIRAQESENHPYQGRYHTTGGRPVQALRPGLSLAALDAQGPRLLHPQYVPAALQDPVFTGRATLEAEYPEYPVGSAIPGRSTYRTAGELLQRSRSLHNGEPDHNDFRDFVEDPFTWINWDAEI